MPGAAFSYNARDMIAHLRGKLLVKHPNQAVVDAGGVGYDVAISVPTFSDLPAVGSEVSLHVHTHVREDQIALYGFLRAAEKQLFEKLIGVSGIGPKLAITILSGMATDDVVGAVGGKEIAQASRHPGRGEVCRSREPGRANCTRAVPNQPVGEPGGTRGAVVSEVAFSNPGPYLPS